MAIAPSVLIVDSSAENREVLRTVLERRGLATLEANDVESGLELARQHHPDVIVLDAEADRDCGDELHGRLSDEATEHDSRLIVLGKIRRQPAFAGGHVIAKPYHYAPLIHTIERLAAKAA
jgi:CheY-like chemotaxis protein